MNQFNQNKTSRKEAWTKFEIGTDFYIPVGVVLIELDSSNHITEAEDRLLSGEKGNKPCNIAVGNDNNLAQQCRTFSLQDD
jgi:hypothetical protein